jgi:hypothetical protein
MMMHLSDDVLLTLAETGDAHPHLERCSRCRAQVESARETLAAVRDVAAPEPSPLFWEHFSVRVRQSIAAGAGSPRPWAAWLGGRDWRPAAIAALAVCVLATAWSLGVFRVHPAEQVAVVAPAGGQQESRVGGADVIRAADVLAPDGERAWAVVTEMADSFDLDAAAEAGFALAPGATDQMVLSLSPSEQREFVRLLQTAIDDPS